VDFYTKSRAFSIEKAKRLLGYLPEVSLGDWIRRTLDWYVANGYIDGLHLVSGLSGTNRDPIAAR